MVDQPRTPVSLTGEIILQLLNLRNHVSLENYIDRMRCQIRLQEGHGETARRLRI